MLSPHPDLHYRPEIDGMRALAVLAVVLYHAGVPFLSGGYVGVDVFFVISGYLITSMMAAQHQAGTFSLLRFYERRARRILPALFVILIAVAATAWMLIPEKAMRDAYQSVLGALGMSSNIVFWRLVSYWDPAVDLRPLLHTWSLGVEEQFYLLYPLLFWLLWKGGKGERRGRRVFLPIAAVGIVGSFGLMWWVNAGDPKAAFYLLPTRVWELLAGAAVAWLLPNQARGWESAAWHVRWRQAGALAGLILVALAVCTSPLANMTRLLLSVAGAALLLAFAAPTTWAGRLLGSRPLVGIGLISYSIYLIHQPVFAAVRLSQPAAPGLPTMLAAAVAVLLLAWASWRFVEQPFRRENTVSRRAFFSVMGVGAVVIAGMGVAGRMTDAPAALYRATSTERQRAVYDETFLPKTVDGDSECRILMSDLRPQLFEQYERCVARYGQSILVLGDSHAGNLFDGLKQVSHRPFVVRVALESCDAAQPPCAYRDIFEFIRARRHTVQMVLYLNTGNKVMYGGRGGTELVPERVDAYFARLATVAGLPDGPQVYMIGPYVEPRLVVQPLLRYAVACEPAGRTRVPPDAVQRIRQIDAAFAQRAPAFPAVHYISTLGRYFEEKDAYLYDCGALYWLDGDHLTAAGARRLVAWLSPYIPGLVSNPSE